MANSSSSSNNNNNNNNAGSNRRQQTTTKIRNPGIKLRSARSKEKDAFNPQDTNVNNNVLKVRKTQTLLFDEQLPIPELSVVASAVLVASLALVSYWTSCHGDFVFDDHEAILSNKDLIPETPVWNLFRNDFWGDLITKKESHKSYRPLTVLTFRLNYFLGGGLHPWGFHLVNILLHAVISVLLLPVSSILLGAREPHQNRGRSQTTPRASLLCAVLFAVHPVHTENVAGVVGRADLLCALFFFLSFLLYDDSCAKNSSCLGQIDLTFRSIRKLLMSMVCCAAATLCKEQGITVLGVCSIHDIVVNCNVDPVVLLRSISSKLHRHGLVPSLKYLLHSPTVRWLKSLLLRQLVLVMFGVLLLICRFAITGISVPSFKKADNPASFAESLWIRVINYNYIYSLNVWLLFNPWWLCFDWSMGCVPLIQSPSDPRILAPILFWCILGCLIHQCFYGSNHYHRRTLTMSLVMLVIPFLPASNLFFRVGFVIAERVLYLSSAGFCLLVAMGMGHLCQIASPRTKRIIQGILIILITSHVIRCVHRSHDWQTEERLYRTGLQVCPFNAKVHYNIGKCASDRGQTEEAIVAYREAIGLEPEYDQALNNLGNLLGDLNRTHEAERLISKAVRVRPTFAAAWMNLGIVQVTLKKYAEAEVSYRTALLHRKNYPDCYFNLGNMYLAVGKSKLALSAWLNATSMLKTHAEAWNNVLLLLDNLGQFNTAVSVGREALKHLPQEPAIYYALGNVMGKMEKYQEAEQMFLKAIRYNPSVANYHGNLGVIYHKWGKFQEARQCYQRSLTLDPTAEVTLTNLEKLDRTQSKRRKK